ncbi:MAG TPA: flagellar hook-basal body protein [Candidatus Saccharimonadales bacterium]|nr:flagellar hook-basal body protein [Candidatus Saccharimonadales bacterium]
MNVSLFQAAAAMNTNARWQELISENLSGSSIPGYKKQDLSFAAVQAGQSPAGVSGTQGVTLPKAVAVTNFRQGEIKSTGVNTDVALEGPGFLSVQLPDGNIGYTRDGELHVNSTGQLVTKQGLLVMGDGGPIQLDPSNSSPLSISATGEVSQGSDSKGKLQISDFSQPHLLTPISHGCFIPGDPSMRAEDAPGTTVRQGFVEVANTSSSSEMVNLIAAMRMYEANQRVVQMHDERMGKAISELGNS